MCTALLVLFWVFFIIPSLCYENWVHYVRWNNFMVKTWQQQSLCSVAYAWIYFVICVFCDDVRIFHYRTLW